MPTNIAAQIAAAQAFAIALVVAETEKPTPLDLNDRALLSACTAVMLAEVHGADHTPREIIASAAHMWAVDSAERKVLRRALRQAFAV